MTNEAERNRSAAPAARRGTEHRETDVAAAVGCSDWFGSPAVRRQVRLNGANDFLEPVAVSPADACGLRVAKLAKPSIPCKRGQVSQPPAFATCQDDDGFAVHRLLHETEV